MIDQTERYDSAVSLNSDVFAKRIVENIFGSLIEEYTPAELSKMSKVGLRSLVAALDYVNENSRDFLSRSPGYTLWLYQKDLPSSFEVEKVEVTSLISNMRDAAAEFLSAFESHEDELNSKLNASSEDLKAQFSANIDSFIDQRPDLKKCREELTQSRARSGNKSVA